MSLNELIFSLVSYAGGPFFKFFSFSPARDSPGAATRSIPANAAPAVSAAADADAMNWRRFRYSSFGVISEDFMSTGFLISMGCPPRLSTHGCRQQIVCQLP